MVLVSRGAYSETGLHCEVCGRATNDVWYTAPIDAACDPWYACSYACAERACVYMLSGVPAPPSAWVVGSVRPRGWEAADGE